MRAELLDVILVYNNPQRWESRKRLFLQSVKHMLESGVRVTIVECAYGDIPHEFTELASDRVRLVQVNAKTTLWIKENLLQLGLQSLPPGWKYVAWVDGDITFRHKHWASETVYALQHAEIVQPWEHCYDLGPNGEHMQLHRSFMSVLDKVPAAIGKHGVGYTFAHPGYAWAATRHALESLGGFKLIEHAICGAGDHHLALALVNKVRASLPGGIHENYVKPLLELERRAQAHISDRLHYLAGAIEHAWHGNKEHRFYQGRWEILTKHGYDPQADIKTNTSGVLELLGNKPGLARDMLHYFQARKEDGNVM